MHIDTDAIRRLRDGLLARASEAPADLPGAGPEADPARREAILRRVEPFAETMFLVMMADNEPAAAERQALIGAFDALTAGSIGPEALGALLDRFLADVQREGAEARLQRLGSRLMADRDDRETAFTLAAVVAIADAEVDPRENHMLALVREHFGISDKRAAVLLGT